MSSTVKSRHWVSLAFAAGLLIAIIVVRKHSGFDHRVVDKELTQLRNEHASLVAIETALSKIQPVVVDEDYDQIASWSCPAGWSVQIGSSEDPGIQTWSFKTDSTPTWIYLVQTINQLTKKPGLLINTVDIRSRGTLTQREIASVEIELVYPTQTPPRLGVADGGRVSGHCLSSQAPGNRLRSFPSGRPTACGFRASLWS